MSLFTPISTRRRIVLRRDDPDEEKVKVLPLMKPLKAKALSGTPLLTGHENSAGKVLSSGLPPRAVRLLNKVHFRSLRLMFSQWRRIVGPNGSRANNKKLVLQLLASIPLSFYNSSHHLQRIKLADNNHQLSMLRKGWSVLFEDILKSKQIDQLIPSADAHFRAAFLSRVVVPVFELMRNYFFYRLKRRNLKRQADLHRQNKQHRKGYSRIFNYKVEVQAQRAQLKGVAASRDKNSKTTTLRRAFWYMVRDHKYFTGLVKVARNHAVWRRQKMALKAFALVYMGEVRLQKSSWLCSRQHFTRYSYHHSLFTLHMHAKDIKARTELMLLFYRHKLLLRVLRVLYLECLSDTNRARTAAATQIQRILRGKLSRSRARAMRVSFHMGALVLQRVCRIFLAKKRLRAQRRVQTIRNYNREVDELQRMWSEECATRLHYHFSRAAEKIQSLFRGFLVHDFRFTYICILS